MIEQVARFPRIRDRALFIGGPDDVVDRPFGPGLPGIREWTSAHYDFPGYVLPFDPAEFADREGLRARLGLPGRRAGGVRGGGRDRGRPAPAAESRGGLPADEAARPRSPARSWSPDRGSIPPGSRRRPGVEYRTFVPDLYAHLAGCDLAIVQGGLSTCMELTATKRPFLYFPLRNHFEQSIHVPHRLARYGAGVRMDYAEADPETLAHAVAEGLKRPVTLPGRGDRRRPPRRRADRSPDRRRTSMRRAGGADSRPETSTTP